MKYLIIDEKLQSLSPPLSDEEFAELEESLLKNGCMSHLAVWNDILLDGHKRYNICQKHGIPYSVGYVMLDTLKDAKAWILAHHLGRKNTKTKYLHGKGMPKHRIRASSKMSGVSESLKDEKTKREQERSYFFPARESEWYHPIVDQRIIDEVAEENEKYVITPTRFAKKLVRRYRHCLCKNYVFSQQAAEEIFNDVLWLSVAKAVKKYDPVRGAKFSTFVYSRLRYDIIREYRSHIKRFSAEHSGLDITDRAGLPTSLEVEPFFQPNDQKNPKSQAILSPTSSDKDLLFLAYWSAKSANLKYDEDESTYDIMIGGKRQSAVADFGSGNRQNGEIVEFPFEDQHLQEVEVKDFFETCSIITDEEVSSLSRRYIPRSMRGMNTEHLKRALAEVDMNILWCIWNGRSLTEEREDFEALEARKTKRKRVNHRKFFDSRKEIILAKASKLSAEQEKK